MRRTDFHFDLPDALIARHPAPERSASRMLHLDGATGAIVDRRFRDLPGLLRRGDLLGDGSLANVCSNDVDEG